MNREGLLRILHLTALGSFAVSQPLLEVLRSDPVFFVARGSTAADLVILSSVSALLVPTIAAPLLWGAEKISRSLARWLHLVMFAGLAALLLSPPLQRGVDSATLVLSGSALGGIAAATLYAHWQGFRSFFTALSPAPLVFVALFLFRPPVSKLLLEGKSRVVAGVSTQPANTLVMVLLDELPLASLLDAEQQIDSSLFPNFAALAGQSIWFRNATASHTMSEHAVPAILTGREPVDQSLLPIEIDHPLSIFTLLEASHRMEIHETFTALAGPPAEPLPERMRSLWEDVSIVYAHIVLPQASFYELTPIWGTWGNFRQQPPSSNGISAAPRSQQMQDAKRRRATSKTNRTKLFRSFIDSMDSSSEPTFYFLHVLSPHYPWNQIASGKHYDYQEALPGYDHETGWQSEEAASISYQRHLLQLGQVDSLLGELLDRLEGLGLLERAVVVVTADHGCSFLVGERMRGGSEKSVRDILHVPLFVKLPGQTEGRIDERNVEAFDILPTLADALGVEVSWRLDGTSALDASLPARKTKTLRRKQQIGEPIVVDAAPPTRIPGLDLKLRFFGSRPGWEGVYAMGPRPDLLGRARDELALSDPARAVARIQDASRFEAVNLGSETFIGYIEGSVEGPDLPPGPLAISVNGRIWAVIAPHSRSQEKLEFVAMLPESALQEGANLVEVYAVLDEDRLSPIEMRD